MTNLEDRFAAILQKNRRKHYICEDRFYSCPKAEGGCADPRFNEFYECNCGADEANIEIDLLLKEYEERKIMEKRIERLHAENLCLAYARNVLEDE